MKKLLLMVGILVSFIGLQAKDTVEEIDNLFKKLITEHTNKKNISCDAVKSILGEETGERTEEIKKHAISKADHYVNALSLSERIAFCQNDSLSRNDKTNRGSGELWKRKFNK